MTGEMTQAGMNEAGMNEAGISPGGLALAGIAHAGAMAAIHRTAFPPREAFRGIDPAVIAVGHGPPLTVDAGAAMRRVLGRARRQLPGHWMRFGLEALTASRAARQARR